MRRIPLLFIIFGLFVASSCLRPKTQTTITDDDLLLRENDTLQAPEQLSQAEAKKDISVLLHALQNGYGGRKYIPSEIFQKAITEVSSIQQDIKRSVRTQDLCKKIADVLFELPDNHLSASLDGQDCSSDHEQAFNEGRVGKNIGQESEKIWLQIFKSVNGKRVPVLSLMSLPLREDKAWEGFLLAVQTIKDTAPALIVDLRGNGGGASSQPRNMVQILYGGDVPDAYEVGIKSQTTATLAMAVNNIQLQINRLKSSQQEIHPYLLNRLNRALQNYADAKAGKLPIEKREYGSAGAPFDPGRGFAKPILILIDRACLSSCESTLEDFEAHPYAVTIGENTGGFIHFGNMGQLVLPNSKIVVQMATDYWKYRDNRFLEKIGYTPQIRVPKGQDAMAVAIAELQKRLK